MLDLIHLTVMEKSLKNQYQNASNISARINLHSLYSRKSGRLVSLDLYPVARFRSGMQHSGTWMRGWRPVDFQNLSRLPKDVHITLSDISEGMLRDARRAIGRNFGSPLFF